METTILEAFKGQGPWVLLSVLLLVFLYKIIERIDNGTKTAIELLRKSMESHEEFVKDKFNQICEELRTMREKDP